MTSPRKRWIGLAASLLLAVSVAHADDTGELRQSLDGPWDFTTDAQAVSDPAAKWDSITVPGNWDTLPAYSTYAGKGWYRRTFRVPADWRGKHLRLTFGAVNEEATVTLNGQELGTHRGGYTPFEFDVTDKVAYDADNTLLVCADNTIQRGAWWHWGGISRSVALVANNDVRLIWQHITATPDLAAGTAQVAVRYRIANDGAAPATIHVASHPDDDATPWVETGLTVPAHSTAETTAAFPLPRDAVHLWDFDHPYLYTLRTTLTQNGALQHEARDRFGIRRVEVKPDGLYLNGERVRLCGFNRVSDSNQYGNTEPDVLVHGDVDLMKRAGADMARLMHFPQAPNLLDYLDEKGMLIFEEIPVWGGGDPNMKSGNPLTEQWLREMIDRDYNHPCIIGWSAGNEMQGSYNYVKSMHEYIRGQLDSSRLLSYVSNTADGKYIGRTNEPATISDLILLNKYGGFGPALATVHQRWPDKPVFFSEWGVRQIGASPDARIPNFDKIWADTVTAHPYLIGLSVWTFNDYRSGFKGTPPSGNREWGVVGVDRHPKAAYQQVRHAYSPVHALTVTPGQVRIEPRSPDEIPSYALRGYHLKWTAGTQTGDIPVPDLKPGDPPWESPLPNLPNLQVSLITPTGYDLTDATCQ
ncbi:MAG TPA: glycoside hydrolase family 2 TIM barrel-domain containing protein [Candidatus Methylacidiphilales bacterium]|nr:glycoside hydrolase family 2 TIM barrel-domain containing protein [Candidatus Methylacidiphilales bacterium]